MTVVGDLVHSVRLPGSAATLEPVRREDLALLYERCLELGPAWLRISAGGVPPPVLFPKVLQQRALAQYLVMLDGVVLAYCSVYDADLRSGTAWLECFDVADVDSGSATWSAIERAVVVHHLTTWHLRRLINERLELAPPILSMVQPIGRRSDDVRLGGAYWDRVIGVIERAEIMTGEFT